jgi:hypothetical protein
MPPDVAESVAGPIGVADRLPEDRTIARKMCASSVFSTSAAVRHSGRQHGFDHSLQ